MLFQSEASDAQSASKQQMFCIKPLNKTGTFDEGAPRLSDNF